MPLRRPVRLCALGTMFACLCGHGYSATDRSSIRHRVVLSPWEQAQAARTTFEAAPAGTHTKAEYLRILDGFRAVYHDTPRDHHAAEAVFAVAELLAEEGREFSDPQSLQSAVGQYEFLRTQYPGSVLRTRALLAEHEIQNVDARSQTGPREKHVARGVASPAAGHPLAQVTGIRHWSTATYTRVAIDLGNEVTYTAARVPNPDRIYFDLHGARLGPELLGKSFSVSEDGFLKHIQAAQATGDVTRVVLDVKDVTDYSAFLLPNPYRLIIDIHGAKPADDTATRRLETPAAPVAAADSVRSNAAANRSGLPATAVTDGGIQTSVMSKENGRSLAKAGDQPRLPESKRSSPASTTRSVGMNTLEVAAVSDAPGKVEATTAPTSKPISATVPSIKEVTLGSVRRRHVTRNSDAMVIGDTAAPAKAAERTADGQTSMVRALGLKIGRIVIDAGHGGHDSGTLGVEGIQEKDVVLDVALRLGKLLNDRLGAQIIYTRSDDTFIPLETRTAIANKAQADLFLSIHANSSADESARGVETYYLNFTSDANALDVAARENAVGGQSIHQLSDLVKKITLKDKIAESREFASDVEGSLYAGLAKGNDGLRNRGVKKAPFVVLIGANMPSILAEISFVTNARDAGQLRLPEYRERVAESLFAGVAKYENGLAGAKVPQVQRASSK